MKRYGKKLLAAMLAASLVVPGVAPVGTAQAAEGEKQIQILATSDLHGRFVSWDYAINEADTSGSLAQVATIIKERRNDNTILLDVGDTIESNSSSLFFDEEVHPMVAGFNFLDFDLWVAGNHEFNYGVDTLLKVAKQFEGEMLCGNVYDKSTNKEIGKDYVIIEKDGVKVAIIGYVTPNITRWDAEKLVDYDVVNPIEEMKATLKELEGKADVFVAALHMMEESEFELDGSGADYFAKNFPELDVVIAAHGHTLVNKEVNGVLVVENQNAGKTLADIDITVKADGKGGYDVVSATAEMVSAKGVEADAEFVAALEKYNTRAKEDASTVVGELKGGDLVPATEINGITQSRLQETAMIDLINQVQMYYADADVSAAAAFSDTANMKEGPIKKSDNTLIYKFDNTLYRLEMTGKQLKQYMEWSASYYNTYKDGDLTISFSPTMAGYLYDMFGGVKYEINISKEAGNRIENLTRMDGTPIKDDDVLTIAVNNYRANSQLLSYTGGVYIEENGDTLPKLLEKDVHAGKAVRDMIGEWIIEKYDGVLTPEVDGNWKITGNNWNEKLHKKVAKLVNKGKLTIANWNTETLTVEDLEGYVDVAKIKVKANGGEADAKYVYAVEGKKLGNALPTVTREGYEFKGWYTKKNGGEEVTAKTLATDGKIVARWEKMK